MKRTARSLKKVFSNGFSGCYTRWGRTQLQIGHVFKCQRVILLWAGATVEMGFLVAVVTRDYQLAEGT